MGENDRKLLELAAKAAGIVGECQHFGIYVSPERTADNNAYWNPLTDDGDALRLAVKLRIELLFTQTYVSASKRAQKSPLPTVVRIDNDPERSTRRAIVRAAAEIGKAMP